MAKIKPVFKAQDLRTANIQKKNVAIGSAITGCLEQLCKQSSAELDVPNLIRTLTDSVAMLGRVKYDISLRRRDVMSPALTNTYKGLCSHDHDVTSNLFGYDHH